LAAFFPVRAIFLYVDIFSHGFPWLAFGLLCSLLGGLLFLADFFDDFLLGFLDPDFLEAFVAFLPFPALEADDDDILAFFTPCETVLAALVLAVRF
jgi:hypothetical protein